MVLGLLCASGFAQAEMDGSKILMEEAERAKEVQRLQYQAELLKQRAEIAKYAEQIQKHGGDVSDLNGQPASRPNYDVAPSAAAAPADKKQDLLPKVLNIENNRAAFDTQEGKVFGKVTVPVAISILPKRVTDGSVNANDPFVVEARTV